MHRPIPARSSLPSRKACLALAAAGAVLGLGAAVPTPALAQASDDEWTRRLRLGLSARDLGLRPEASARGVARAALARNAGRLGVPRSLRGVRLARTQRVPRGPNGARELHLLRFQQTVRGTRVLWSQIDVTIAAGRVSSIAATVVPVTGRRLANKPEVSRNRALRIARRAVNGPEEALQPLRVAYAGTPTTNRKAKRRTPRLAWVVETTPASGLDGEVPTPLCIVVDAKTGKVTGRWWGIADRPDRGPQARGAQTANADRDARLNGATARSAQTDGGDGLLDVRDGTGADLNTSDPFDGTTRYATFVVDGDPHRGANWPPFTDSAPWNRACTQSSTPLPCVNYFGTHTDVMDAVATNARNVAFTICGARDYCGMTGSREGEAGYRNWQVIGNINGPSHADASTLAVEIGGGNEMDGTQHCHTTIDCPQGPPPPDPRPPYNDVIAHEFGHIRDFVTAGDRSIDPHDHRRPAVEARTVQEALADMFAYDYDRENATLGEDLTASMASGSADWEDPGAVTYSGRPQPDHMDDYVHPPPPKQDGGVSDVHFNATILSHAYYLLVQDVGHDRAGHVLKHVPSALSPKPTFGEVARHFIERAHDHYGGAVSAPAQAAFAQVGIELPVPGPPEDPDCGPEAC